VPAAIRQAAKATARVVEVIFMAIYSGMLEVAAAGKFRKHGTRGPATAGFRMAYHVAAAADTLMRGLSTTGGWITLVAGMIGGLS
jgi:hypothetical protein